MLGHCTIVCLDLSYYRDEHHYISLVDPLIPLEAIKATRPFSFNVCASLSNRYNRNKKFVSSQYKSAAIGKGRCGAMKQQLVKELKSQDYAASNMTSHITRE